ncbi:hypothetical protein NKH77_29755 [Streptomyces sp. M19]
MVLTRCIPAMDLAPLAGLPCTAWTGRRPARRSCPPGWGTDRPAATAPGPDRIIPAGGPTAPPHPARPGGPRPVSGHRGARQVLPKLRELRIVFRGTTTPGASAWPHSPRCPRWSPSRSHARRRPAPRR